MSTMPYAQTIDETQDLWGEFVKTGSEQIKEKLVMQYLPLVQYVVGRMFAHLPSHVTREDLHSTGILGLLESIKRFDPMHQVDFRTFAIPRIRGAILDELRTYDHASRSSRNRMREVQDAVRQLQNALKRNPTESEIAEKMGMDIHAYHEMLTKIKPVRVIPISELNEEGVVADTESEEDHRLELSRQELKETLVKAIRILPKKEKLVIALYYYERMTMKEIAVVLQVTEGRVSQLHTQALIRLRSSVD